MSSSSVRVLVGTRKGAFIITGWRQENWTISDPSWRMGTLPSEGSPADPNRIYTSQVSGWFGQPLIQRFERRWQRRGEAVDKQVRFTTAYVRHAPGGHDGTPPREFKRAQATFEPSSDRSRHRLRGRRRRGRCSARLTAARAGTNSRVRAHGTGTVAARRRRLCLHTIIDQQRSACSSRSRRLARSGRRWRRELESDQPGALHRATSPTRPRRSGRLRHHVAQHRRDPTCC